MSDGLEFPSKLVAVDKLSRCDFLGNTVARGFAARCRPLFTRAAQAAGPIKAASFRQGSTRLRSKIKSVAPLPILWRKAARSGARWLRDVAKDDQLTSAPPALSEGVPYLLAKPSIGRIPISMGRPDHSAQGDALFDWPIRSEQSIPMLAFDGSSGLGRIIRAVRPDIMAAARTVFTSHLATALKVLASEGKGLAWLPQSFVENEPGTADTLVEVGDGNNRISIDVILLRPKRQLGLKAEALWQATNRLALC